MIDGGLVWFVQFDSRRVLRHGCDFAHAFSKFVFLAPFCARLNTLQVANLDEFTPITKVADFVTLLGTYSQGFTIIVDPYPEAQGIYDPTLILRCLDASIAIRPVLKRYQSVVLTSGTISPLEMYPKKPGIFCR